MLNTQSARRDAEAALMRADLIEPRPELEREPFHFAQEYRDMALRHVWTRNQAIVAARFRDSRDSLQG